MVNVGVENIAAKKIETSPKVLVEQVTKTFDSNKGDKTTALAEVNLTIKENEFITILGPSGCGKSTLLRIVGGLEEQTTGRVLLDGGEVSGPSEERGFVFQSYSLFPWLTVKENIEFGLKNKKVPLKEREEISKEYIDLIGLHGFSDHYPKQLSGGMQQRVAIARALANDPQILLLDEPFGALDNQTRSLMQESLLNIWEKTHKTILFVTHDVEEAIFLASRVLVMTSRPGKIKADIPIDLEYPRSYQLKSDPRFLEYKSQIYEMIREESIKATNIQP